MHGEEDQVAALQARDLATAPRCSLAGFLAWAVSGAAAVQGRCWLTRPHADVCSSFPITSLSHPDRPDSQLPCVPKAGAVPAGYYPDSRHAARWAEGVSISRPGVAYAKYGWKCWDDKARGLVSPLPSESTDSTQLPPSSLAN